MCVCVCVCVCVCLLTLCKSAFVYVVNSSRNQILCPRPGQSTKALLPCWRQAQDTPQDFAVSSLFLSFHGKFDEA